MPYIFISIEYVIIIRVTAGKDWNLDAWDEN